MKPGNEMDIAADWEIILSDEEFLDDVGNTNNTSNVSVHQMNYDYFTLSPHPDPPTPQSNNQEHPSRLFVEKTTPTNPKPEATVAGGDDDDDEEQQLGEEKNQEQEVEQVELKITGAAAVSLEKMMDDHQQDVSNTTVSQQQLVEEKQEQEGAHMELIKIITPAALPLEKMIDNQEEDISDIRVSQQHLDFYKKMRKSLDSATAAFQFDKKDSEPELHDDEKMAAPADSDIMMIQKHNNNDAIRRRFSDDHGGINKLWKKSLMTGIGAICSFGITACVIIFTSTQHMNNNIKLQRPRFQIYTNHNKVGFKQVVHIT